MSGGLGRRLRLYRDMVRYGNAHNEDFAREHWTFFQELRNRVVPFVGELAQCRVLDVGCGKSFWLTLLLHSAGARATGIDTEVVQRGLGLRKIVGLVRANGWERAARTLAWEVGYARSYYAALAHAASFPLRFDGLDLRSVGAAELPFPDSEFDLAVSHEVFEHLPDVRAAVASLGRVLKPGGLACVYIHNYASLSGGHHIAWKYPDSEPSDRVPPWDHLRANQFPDIPSWINRLRERDYRDAFDRGFEVMEWLPIGREGERQLTPAIRAELGDYTDEELLTKGYLVLARPRKGSTPT